MGRKGESSSFWVSYADLMTSLFFIMLVLVVVLITFLQTNKELKAQVKEYEATAKQVEKIRELEAATKGLDSRYFSYNDNYKKFVLNIPVEFPRGSSNLEEVPSDTKEELYHAGKLLYDFIKSKNQSDGAHFVLVIEGQASKDKYYFNNELSYSRALALKKFWENRNLFFNPSSGCELIVAGSGVGGHPRSEIENQNQRFLVTLINKPGIIE